jgi:hypothetical protein
MNSRGPTECVHCAAGERIGENSGLGSNRATAAECCDINLRKVVSLAHTATLASINVITWAFTEGGSASVAPCYFGRLPCFISDSRKILP